MLGDLGLLILRIVLGIVFMAHGSQKLFGWFGGPGLKGFSGWMASMGLRPAALWGLIAALFEFGGGLLTILGLLNPIGPLAIIAVMLMATIKVHLGKGFWNSKGGYEFPLVNIASALAVALIGPGTYSLDAALGTHLPEPATLLVGVVLVILGLVVALGTQQRQPAVQGQPGESRA
jgi:putative oxidoreductase